ncbi:MAG: aldehyde dehydrogenase family protein, partial [Acidimicrobiia bacterium]|nr:aldehyde dehydrogenase family protein [Acidimicrobiia bacterium]
MPEAFSSEEVHEIIARVRRRLGGTEAEAPARPRVPAQIPESDLGEGLFATIEEAVKAAERAFNSYQSLGPDGRQRIVDSIRRTMLEHADRLARIAVEETGLGRIDDKLRKILLVSNRTPGPEDLDPIIVTGEHGMMLTEMAPMGLIAAITPTTNPVSTVINNAIAVLSGGNAVVFNVHPNAK